MKTGINWDVIRTELDGMEWEDEGFGDFRREVFIGTAFSLTPSGKYYTPWACSNVTEEEAEKDEAWWEAAESEADARGLYLTSGEGDPCDILAGEYSSPPCEA